MQRLRFALVALAALLYLNAQAQLKPLNLPKCWELLRYDDKDGNYYTNTENAIGKEYWNHVHKRQDRNNDRSWYVWTKRGGVELYDSPGGARAGRTYPFGHILWVWDEKEAYVKVGNELRAEGWVEKSDLILWGTPLVDHGTGMEIKAFAVNTTKASKRIYDKQEHKERFDVFDQPQGGSKLKDHLLYDVLFVFQYAPGVGAAPGRYLVSDNFVLSSAKGLMGWVNEDRIKTWSTSLCLEPNWDEDAMAERRRKRVYANVFDENSNSARDAYFAGTAKGGGIYAEPRDPAYDSLGIAQRSRLDGFIFRYPVFAGDKVGMDANNCLFQTGTPTRLDSRYSAIRNENYSQDAYVRTERAYEAMEKGLQKLNVIFVIEGELGVQRQLAPVIEGLRKAYAQENTLSIGAVVYRNDDSDPIPERDYINQQALVPQGKGVAEWLINAAMGPSGDAEDATRPAYLALIRGMGMAREGETNVLVHWTRRPDHSYDSDFTDSRSGYKSPKELRGPLATKDIHYLGYTTEDETFEDMRTNTLHHFGNAIAEINTLHLVDRTQALRPQEAKEEGRTIVYMEPTTLEFRACQLPVGVDPSRLLQWITADLKKCQEAYKKHFEVLRKHLYDGSDQADKVSAAGMETSNFMVHRLCTDPSFSRADRQDCLEYVLAQKVHYFVLATTPYRSKELTHPVFRYVLFMHQDKLNEQISAVERLVSDMDGGVSAKTREALKKYWENVARNVMGKSDPNMPIVELKKRMSGVTKNMNIVLPFTEDQVAGGLTIGDIDNPKKYTEAVNVVIKKQLTEQLSELEKVRRDPNAQYRAKRDEGEIFYWVPIECLLR